MGICRREFGACLAGGLAAGLLRGAGTRPKLLVLVVLEQFRSDYLSQVRGQLAPGGFRFLAEKGAVFHDCRNLASTFPSSSIATLATGTWPAQHGIVADYWYDRALRKQVRGTEEDLVATTLASQILDQAGTSVTVVALEETHAALFAGSPDARIYWMDVEGQMATRGEVPGWLAGYNSQNRVERFHDIGWLALGARPDAPPLRTLTWSKDRPQEFMELYRASPFAQSSQFDFVNELIIQERLGLGPSLDLLCVLAGSSELLGYETGAQHPLMRQMVLQIDRRLEIFIGQLTKTLGDNNFNLAVVGAHGAPPEPDADSRASMAVNGEKLAQAVDSVLLSARRRPRGKIPVPVLLSGHDQGPRSGCRAPRGSARRARTSRRGWLLHRGRRCFCPQRLGEALPQQLPSAALRRLHALLRPRVHRGIRLEPGRLLRLPVQLRRAACRCSSTGRSSAPGSSNRTVELIDLAPTLAEAMGAAYPSSSDGRVLGEAFAG